MQILVDKFFQKTVGSTILVSAQPGHPGGSCCKFCQWHPTRTEHIYTVNSMVLVKPSSHDGVMSNGSNQNQTKQVYDQVCVL